MSVRIDRTRLLRIGHPRTLGLGFLILATGPVVAVEPVREGLDSYRYAVVEHLAIALQLAPNFVKVFARGNVVPPPRVRLTISAGYGSARRIVRSPAALLCMFNRVRGRDGSSQEGIYRQTEVSKKLGLIRSSGSPYLRTLLRFSSTGGP